MTQIYEMFADFKQGMQLFPTLLLICVNPRNLRSFGQALLLSVRRRREAAAQRVFADRDRDQELQQVIAAARLRTDA